MIFITGDTHAYLDDRKKFFDLMNKDDILIVLGDFGFSWDKETERDWNNQNYQFLTLSVLGNHENYYRVYETYPLVDLLGGSAYKFNDNTFYLKNGEMYEIDSKKFFVFGGALSIDKAYRTPYVSWWPQEVPSGEEYNHALETLEKNNWTFDYFFTHTGSDDEIKEMFGIEHPIEDRTQTMISKLMFDIKDHGGKFEKHFFGHMHELSQRFGENFDSIALYDQIYSLDRNELVNF